jgi:hypothetical protein
MKKSALLASTSLPTALLGKTPESMPSVHLSGSIHTAQCLVVVDGFGRVHRVSGWDLIGI